jgi:predicted phosphohydrolase
VHNEEISRTMKMQENLNKLNLFCKKSLEKQNTNKNVRKRNTTIQGGALTTDPDLSEQRQKDASKISQRKKDRFRRTATKTHKDDRLDEDEVGDSSKLSTEFYEEYFRLLNSIKKEQ